MLIKTGTYFDVHFWENQENVKVFKLLAHILNSFCKLNQLYRLWDTLIFRASNYFQVCAALTGTKNPCLNEP